MIKVVIRNNVERISHNVSDTMTVGDFLDKYKEEIDQTKTAMLNGVTIDSEIEAQTFAQRSNGAEVVYLSYTKNSEGN